MPSKEQIEAAAKAIQRVSGVYGLMECNKLATAGLTAAAEAEESNTKCVSYNATIERCARVARKWGENMHVGTLIADAIANDILALKDKP